MRLVTAPTATAILARLQVRVRRRDLVRFQVRSLAQDLFPALVRLLTVRMHRPKQAEAMVRLSIRATMHRATHPRMAP